MDLVRFIANQDLLERLSREYELLKASGANVDYAAWVRQRLREAAAEIVTATVDNEARSCDEQLNDNLSAAADGTLVPAADEITLAGDTAEGRAASAKREQLILARRFAPTLANAPPTRPALEAAATGGARPEKAWFIRGEGAGHSSTMLSSAIYGPSADRMLVPAQALPQDAQVSRGRASKKVVIVSPPRKSPLQQRQPPQPRYSPKKPQLQKPNALSSAQPHPGKLYTRSEPGLFSVRPGAYVHPPARANRDTSVAAATRPDWVNAASLQVALKGASSAVPHLQAAAERERRLALALALARQTLAVGLGRDQVAQLGAGGGAGGPPGTSSFAATASQASQFDHMLLVAQQLAQQNEQLALAVQLNSAQLAQQQVILDSALQQNQQPLPAQAAFENAAAAAASVEPLPTKSDHTATLLLSPGSRVTVETGPPPWFLHRGTAALTGILPGKALSLSARKLDRQTTAPIGRIKSPVKPAVPRTRSPGPHATTVRPVPTFATTARERERSSRKEALKLLLKQVLGGAGGQEGRWRLANSMAAAEKLVAAIQSLARGKGDREARRQEMLRACADQALPAGKGSTVAETETSRHASAFRKDDATAAPPGEPQTAAALPDASQAGSGARSTGSAAPIDGASVGAAAGTGSRAMSRQGSGRSSMSTRSKYRQLQASAGEAPPPRPPPQLARNASSTGSPGPSEGSGARPSRAESPQSLAAPGSGKVAKSSSTSSAPSTRQATAAETAFRPSSVSASVSDAVHLRSRTSTISADGSAGADAAAKQSFTTVPPTLGRSRAPAPVAGGAIGPHPGWVSSNEVPHLLSAANGGVLVTQSLEDQVQEMVDRDSAAAAEMTRHQKMDSLEQRLHALVDRVENRVGQALKQLTLNVHPQQQQSIQRQMLDNAPLMHSLTAATTSKSSVEKPDAGISTVLDGESLAAVAAAVAAAVVAAAPASAGMSVSGAQRLSRGTTAQAHVSGVDVVSPRSAGLSVLELQRMLIQLNRMESKEQEVRRKWFYDPQDAQNRGRPGLQPIVVRDGQLGTQDPTTQGASASASLRLPSRISSPSGAAVVLELGQGRFAGAEDTSVWAQNGSTMANSFAVDAVSDATVESVLRSRRRFLRAQKLVDGDLMVDAQPTLNPVQVIEDLADALLEEMLHEQATELVGLCDSLGTHLFKDELDLSSDEDDRR